MLLRNKYLNELDLLINLLTYNLKIIRFLGRLFAIWPLNENTKKWEIYVDIFIWYFFHISLWSLVMPTFIAIYKERNNLQSFISSINQLLTIFETLFLMILFKIARLRFRVCCV
jgi:3-methyladenine DNA glycosylase AlkD